MGYDTVFGGSIEVVFKDKKNRDEAAELINGLARTKRVARDLTKVEEHLPKPVNEYGVQGELFFPTEEWPWWSCCGQTYGDPSVADLNIPPVTQPGLWLQWIANPSEDDDTKMSIVWDGNEKFYDYVEWMKYIVSKIIAPRGGMANGYIECCGDDCLEIMVIEVEDNYVREQNGCITYE
jgi:hypothetical protein